MPAPAAAPAAAAAPAPKAKAAAAPAPAPAPAPSPGKPMFANNNQVAGSVATNGHGNNGADAARFNNKKGISSDDFFGQELNESPQARMDRDNRYNKFAGSGAISSNSFFGDGEPEAVRRSSSGDMDEWKDLANKGSQMAKAGLSKGADLLSQYLNKVRD